MSWILHLVLKEYLAYPPFIFSQEGVQCSCNADETLHPTCDLPPSLVLYFQNKCDSQQESVASKTLEVTVSYKMISCQDWDSDEKA